MTTKSRLGWLGPVIVIVGLAVGGVGIWWMRRARPVPGDYIDVVALPAGRAVAIRHEANSEHCMLELWDRGGMLWQALIPRYAGKPGVPAVAYSPDVVSVRVVRAGVPEVFGFTLHSAEPTKTGSYSLASDHKPDPTGAGYTDEHLITATDGTRAFEWVRGPDWAQLFTFDVTTGKQLAVRAFTSAELAGLEPETLVPTRAGSYRSASGCTWSVETKEVTVTCAK